MSLSRAYTWFASGVLLLQGVSTLAALQLPAFDRAVPILLRETQMVASHSILHIASGVIGFVVLRFAGASGTRIFALGFGVFYLGLATIGAAAGWPALLDLKPFDHPFHAVLGALGVAAATAEYAIGRTPQRSEK
jgi:hypothetical protein